MPPFGIPAPRYSLGTLNGVPVEASAAFFLVASWLAFQQSGLAAALAAFVLVAGLAFLHEAAHAWTGRWLGYGIARLPLRPFAGLSSLDPIPASARDDVLATLAGPACSLAMGAALVGLAATLVPGSWMAGPFRDVGFAGLYWGAFNLLPAYPMDGGRLLFRALARQGAPLDAMAKTLRIGQMLVALVGLYGLLSLSFAWMAFAGYLYVLGLLGTPDALREAREAADSATVSPPPYARSGSRRVDVTRL